MDTRVTEAETDKNLVDFFKPNVCIFSLQVEAGESNVE